MIDHVYISVTDIDKSLVFYSEALKPLGWRIFGNYDSASGPEGVPDLYGIGDDAYGRGKAVGSSIWLRQRKPGETGLYLGIVCDTNELVDAAYAAAIKAGGIDEGGQQIEPTSPPVTTPQTLPTSTATVLSSYIKRGIPSAACRLAPATRCTRSGIRCNALISTARPCGLISPRHSCWRWKGAWSM